jgi:glutamate synthase domain-containing protein 2/glutamate synthase domain-containing protein 1/glutamate synthase domain-containing protein 3
LLPAFDSIRQKDAETMFDGRAVIRARSLLYTDEVGHDACGIGAVAAREGKASHEVVKKSLLALRNMEHRGGVCGLSGDGAGITLQLPQPFFKEQSRRLGMGGARHLTPEDLLGVGVFFFHDRDEARREHARDLVRQQLSGSPVQLLGWRTVPTRPDVLPAESRDTMPVVEQLLFKVEAGATHTVERWLYHRRLELRELFRQEQLDVYIPSLSSRLVSYKGLLTSFALCDFYADLTDPSFESGLAIFHRRYSTNTYPNWNLGQPFRFSCHNGEINTIHTNRNAVHAYARGLEPPLPGRDLLTPKMSDSANLDEWLEHLMLDRNWSLLQALRLTVPPVWENEAEVWGADAIDVFTWVRRAFSGLCAWDGPAGIVATDGRVVAGLVDRMGLRPVRWCSDRRGWLYVGSESGVFGLDNTTIVASGQLQPGQMIALDTATGERLDSHQIMTRIVGEVGQELGGDIHELNRSQILIPEAFDFTPQLEDQIGQVLEARQWTVEHLLQAHGWDFERAVFVRDMTKLRKEPLSSMGFDRVLTVFSEEHPTLFKYLQQMFAEVTNPPIDPYREGGAMSLTTYLGRSPLLRKPGPGTGEWGMVNDPSSGSPSESLPCRQMELSGPVLSDAVLEEVRRTEILGLKTFSAVFPLRGGVEALRESVHRLRSEAERAVHDGYNVLCLSDKEAFADGLAPIPSLLALGAVHTYLCNQGLRERCSLVVQTGDVQEGHDIAVLVAFGADAVHPYLMQRLIRDGLKFKDPDTKQDWALTSRESLEYLFAALEDSFKKIISKMGITTIEGYRGARLFEAVGLGAELMDFLGDCPSRVGGIGLAELVEDARWRLARAENMQILGRNRDYHAFNAKVRMALRKAALTGSAAALPQVEPNATEERGEMADAGGEAAYASAPNKTDRALNRDYVDFSDMVNRRVPTCLRDLLRLRPAAQPVPVEETQPALEIVRDHFRGAAMSHGALTRNSHQDIAAALNELGGFSNSGEGGESRGRNDAPERPWGPFWERVLKEREADPHGLTLGGDVRRSRLRSRIRQVASGRFGVDAEYLINGDELQIKMAQGAKPGEGGQLMGKKVTTEIAEIRYGRPGTDLISPPPHHDIYSIEDLAQLIYDLKSLKPGVRVSVKLVAVENVGTIAVGVAKAGADAIEIDGIGGGTGAAMLSSKEHAGLPSEMGLAEAHQALVVNGLRQSVHLRVGGGIKNGMDVLKYALLGADEFSFGQALMVSVGCIVCKSCHIPNCPTGITGTQGEYKGHAEHTKAYVLSVAEEVRGLLATLGARRIEEIVGRSNLLEHDPAVRGRAALVNLSKFLQPDMALARVHERYPQHSGPRGVCETDPDGRPSLNQRVLEAARDAIDSCHNADLMFRIRNSDRAVGATAAGLVARLYGREGLPDKKRVRVRFEGEAGQSFGAWCINGLDLELRGFAQDGVAKGISGGSVVVTLDYDASDYGGEIQSVAGNNVGYGATGGSVFIGGRAGHRLGIRNSGATIVAEAAGKYACEYQTRGRVLILGPVENEIGSGMTGGELFVYDPNKEVPAKLHARSVVVVECTYVDYEWIHPLIITYQTRTGSRRAEEILKNWAEVRRGRRLRKVVPLAVARRAEEYIAAGTNAG